MTPYGQPPTGAGYASGGGAEMTIGDYANGAPNIRLSKIPGSLMRQLPWMIVLFLLMAFASFWFTKDIKREYVADGRMIVEQAVSSVGDGGEQGNLMITPDQIVLTEIGIIKNSESLGRVIHRLSAPVSEGGLGGEKFLPKLYTKWVNAPEGSQTKKDRWNDIVKFVDKSFMISHPPKSSLVDLGFKHEDSDVAVVALTALMKEYQTFRKEIFVYEETDKIGERRAATEKQLNAIERQIQNILNKNGVTDFGAEQTGVQKRAEDQKAALNTLRGQLSAVEAALAATEDQLRDTPPTINLYVDDRASQRLAQAELEKRQLLAKYLPTSNPVKAKEVEIEEIRAQIASNGGQPAGGRRVGPNTVYQALMTQRNTYQAQADSYREQEVTLQRQLNIAQASVKKMRELDPLYAGLVREKTSLAARLTNLNAKEGEALVNRALDEANSESIKVVYMPTTARKGRNMQKILLALSLLGSAFTVTMLGLLRVFLDPALYGPSVQARIHTQTVEPYDQPIYADAGYTEQYSTIPEPVPSYQPVAERMQMATNNSGAPEEYVPTQAYAADAMSYEPAHHPGHVQGYEQGYGQSYGQPAATVTGTPYAPQVYADGTAPYAAPYMSTQPTAYPGAVTETRAAGPNGEVPVLGHVPPQPFNA